MSDNRIEHELVDLAQRLAPSASAANAQEAIAAITSIDGQHFTSHDASRLRLAGQRECL